ncbi:MAG: TlpA family protein disulfide reductase [Nitrospirae bacterium]|nr:TlpA family protein disulfide reductase [Nitrospirota bacterium]
MRYVLIVFTSLVLSFIFLTEAAPSPWGASELIGASAPDFVLKEVNQKTVSLSGLKGNVVLINFWATWCPPCRGEMPSLNKLYRDYRNRGLVVLAVSTDRSIDSVRDYLSSHPVDFPVLIDSDSKVARRFKVFSLPTSYLLDRNGKVLRRFLGEEEWESPSVRKTIEAALGIQ